MRVIAFSSVVGLACVPGLLAEPVGATKRSLSETPEEDEPEELDDELLLLDEELDDDEDDEEEELEEDEELEEELEEDELDDPPVADPKAATDNTSRLPLEAVQDEAFEPVLAARVDPAPPLVELGRSKRSAWPAPGVNDAFDAPLLTTSTSHEPALVTERLAEIARPDATLLVVTASGPRWATPVSEIAPAVSPLTCPENVT